MTEFELAYIEALNGIAAAINGMANNQIDTSPAAEEMRTLNQEINLYEFRKQKALIDQGIDPNDPVQRDTRTAEEKAVDDEIERKARQLRLLEIEENIRNAEKRKAVLEAEAVKEA